MEAQRYARMTIPEYMTYFGHVMHQSSLPKVNLAVVNHHPRLVEGSTVINAIAKVGLITRE
jgi:hypothetical protein